MALEDVVVLDKEELLAETVVVNAGAEVLLECGLNQNAITPRVFAEIEQTPAAEA